MKRTKYNNGGLHTSYSKGIFSVEGSAVGNQNQRTSSATASVNTKGFKASASRGVDSSSGKSTNYSLQKQLPNNSSVTAQKNKYKTSASYHKQTKGGTNLQFGLNKDAQGVFGVSMGFSKPL
jgi:hypothetical protein